MGKGINAKRIRKILSRRDFLTDRNNEERLREKNIIIYVSGTKCAGKSKFCLAASSILADEGYKTLVSRASIAAEETYSHFRRELGKKEGQRDFKTFDFINALRI